VVESPIRVKHAVDVQEYGRSRYPRLSRQSCCMAEFGGFGWRPECV